MLEKASNRMCLTENSGGVSYWDWSCCCSAAWEARMLLLLSLLSSGQMNISERFCKTSFGPPTVVSPLKPREARERDLARFGLFPGENRVSYSWEEEDAEDSWAKAERADDEIIEAVVAEENDEDDDNAEDEDESRSWVSACRCVSSSVCSAGTLLSGCSLLDDSEGAVAVVVIASSSGGSSLLSPPLAGEGCAARCCCWCCTVSTPAAAGSFLNFLLRRLSRLWGVTAEEAVDATAGEVEAGNAAAANEMEGEAEKSSENLGKEDEEEEGAEAIAEHWRSGCNFFNS